MTESFPAVTAKRESGRLIWVDYAKVIGIYLVVFGHLPLSDSDLNQYLSTLRMPLFFVLSGFFEKGESLGKAAKTGAQRLLWPYLIFYLLAYLWTLIETFWLGWGYYPTQSVWECLTKPILGLFAGIGDNTPYSTIVNGPLWFLMALFWVKLLFSLASTLGKGRAMAIYLAQIPLALLALLSCNSELTPLFSLESALLAMPFYAFGYFLKRADLVERARGARGRLLFLAIPAAVGLSVLAFKLNGPVYIANGIYGRNILLCYLGGLSGSLAAIFLCRALPQRRIRLVETVAQGTLVIVGLHLHLSASILRLLGEAFGLPGSFSDLEGLGLALLVIAVLLLPIELIERRAPWILGRFGRRDGARRGQCCGAAAKA